MTQLLAPEEIAALARITASRARLIVRQFVQGGPYGPRTAWRGARLRVVEVDGSRLVDAATLPVDLRERIVMRDQMSLPLPPGTQCFGPLCRTS